MTILKSSAFSISVSLIFDIHELNRVLFLNATSFYNFLFLFKTAAKRSIAPFTTIYA